jgi:lipopolysaccharide cholinephosphotransferase
MSQEEETLKTMKTLKEIFDRHKIETWLDAGTLLGAVREKKFISWDYDVDLGAWHKDTKRILDISDDICKLGFEICFFDFKDYIKILNKEIEIDINLYHQQNNNATRTWYVNNKLGQILDYLLWIFAMKKPEIKKSKAPAHLTSTLAGIIKKIPKFLTKDIIEKLYLKIGCKQVKISIPNNYFKKLSKIEFYGLSFNTPSSTEKYLEYRYGRNWKTPNKNYKFYRDDGAIIKKQ